MVHIFALKCQKSHVCAARLYWALFNLQWDARPSGKCILFFYYIIHHGRRGRRRAVWSREDKASGAAGFCCKSIQRRKTRVPAINKRFVWNKSAERVSAFLFYQLEKHQNLFNVVSSIISQENSCTFIFLFLFIHAKMYHTCVQMTTRDQQASCHLITYCSNYELCHNCVIFSSVLDQKIQYFMLSCKTCQLLKYKFEMYFSLHSITDTIRFLSRTGSMHVTKRGE